MNNTVRCWHVFLPPCITIDRFNGYSCPAAAVTPWFLSPHIISSLLQRARSRDRTTPFEKFRLVCGETFTGTSPSNVIPRSISEYFLVFVWTSNRLAGGVWLCPECRSGLWEICRLQSTQRDLETAGCHLETGWPAISGIVRSLRPSYPNPGSFFWFDVDFCFELEKRPWWV